MATAASSLGLDRSVRDRAARADRRGRHRLQPGELRCESDDDGALDIPAALGAKLIELGAAGNPTLQVIRESFGSAPLAGGQVGLGVQSPITRGLRIAGLISCDEPGAQDVCPDGQLRLPQHRCG